MELTTLLYLGPHSPELPEGQEGSVGWLPNNDWRASKAHLLLLSRFRGGSCPARYWDADPWESVLGESPLKAVERFLEDGMLERADLPEVVDCAFKVPELKSMLRERGLKVSGTKGQLIERFIENDPQGAREATRDLTVYRCTPAARQLAEGYLEQEKARRAAAEADVLRLVSTREFSEAVRVLIRFEASQVFPRGMGIDWNNYDGKPLLESVATIFEKTPAILNGMEQNRLDDLRVAAGMMRLWGENRARHWLPDGFQTGIPLAGDAACRMLVFHASHLLRVQYCRTVGVKTVQVLGGHDQLTCAECRKISGKKYRLASVPDLPHAKCTSEIGCRCMIVPALPR